MKICLNIDLFQFPFLGLLVNEIGIHSLMKSHVLLTHPGHKFPKKKNHNKEK